jgi:integrase/recombinase XerC
MHNLKTDQPAVTIVHTHLVPRTVGIADFAMMAIQTYLASLPFDAAPHDPLFMNNRGGRLSVRTVQLRFRRRRRAIGMRETACPIGLRHGVGEKLAAAGHSQMTIASALGLSPASVAKYFETKKVA